MGADHLVLTEQGLTGHGHVMMVEHGSLEIVALILAWLERRLGCVRGADVAPGPGVASC